MLRSLMRAHTIREMFKIFMLSLFCSLIITNPTFVSAMLTSKQELISITFTQINEIEELITLYKNPALSELGMAGNIVNITPSKLGLESTALSYIVAQNWPFSLDLFLEVKWSLEQAFSHPVLLCWDKQLDMYTAQILTHKEAVLHATKIISKSMAVGTTDLKGMNLAQYICSEGGFFSKNIIEEFSVGQQLKISKLPYDGSAWAQTKENLEQIYKLIQQTSVKGEFLKKFMAEGKQNDQNISSAGEYVFIKTAKSLTGFAQTNAAEVELIHNIQSGLAKCLLKK